MHLKQIAKRAVALMLALLLLLGLSACSASDAIDFTYAQLGMSSAIAPGQRLPNSPWINSDLEGSIDENTELNLKDDFHTTVNRDWFLENDPKSDEEILTNFLAVNKIMTENELRLLTPGAECDPDPNIMSEETLSHLQNLVWDMMELAGNQEKRNELGVEPLRPYLDAIEQIDSLEEMTEYLKNSDNMNFTGENLVNFTVDRPENTRDFYTVHIGSPEHCLLVSFSNYRGIDNPGHDIYKKNRAAVEYVLEQLGYTPKQSKKLIMDCHAFEGKLTSLLPDYNTKKKDSYRKERGDKIYTLEDLEKLQGRFPLTELLEDAGIAHSDTFRIYEPAYLRFMGSYYKEKNLDKIKAYFVVHTVLDSLFYLDETCQNMDQEILVATRDYLVETDPTVENRLYEEDFPEAAEQVQLFNKYILPLIYESFQLTYIGNYCSSDAKAEILNILAGIQTHYIDLLANTEWLSAETREKAIEKMEKMAFRVMYPDVLPDYSGLTYKNYEEGGNLLDAVAAIQKHKNIPAVEKVNQPVKRTDWDLDKMSTLVVNAYNEPGINSIVMPAGMLAGGFMYDSKAPVEQNYGRVGTILGHEVLHSFDTIGYAYDAEGIPYGWWTNEDEVAFHLRADKLAAYYSMLRVLPNVPGTYNGQNVQTEAISDMGGMQCMLAFAGEIPDFDYDLFFRSYASLWRTQTSLAQEIQLSGDVHPLNFLRTNVTLQQFDKFYETYGIGPGDGMYLAPEDRILVW